MNIGKKKLIILLFTLCLLNIVIRIPTFPHEIGSDSFYYHSLAREINDKGFAEWASTPLGLIGVYSSKFANVSTGTAGEGIPSSFPFFLSGISQLTLIDLENTILFFNFFSCIFIVIISFVLAKSIIDDDLIAFIVSFSFSLSPLILLNSLWTASSRLFFEIFIVISLILLFKQHKIKNNYPKMKYFIIFLLILLLLLATHRMVAFYSIIFMAYILSILNNKMDIKIYIKNKPLKILIPWIILFVLLILPQIFKIAIFEKMQIWSEYTSGFFVQGAQWYSILLNMIVDYSSNTGLLIIFSIAGIYFILSKKEKTTEELFLIYFFLIFASISTYGTYMSIFMIVFFSLLIGLGIKYWIDILTIKKVSKIVSFVLLASVIFSIFMLWHWQVFLPDKEKSTYIREDTFDTISFFNNYIYNNKSITNEYGRQLNANNKLIISDFFNSPLYEYDFPEKRLQQFLSNNSINYYINKNSLSGRVRDFENQLLPVRSLNYIVNNKNKIYDNGDLGVFRFEVNTQ